MDAQLSDLLEFSRVSQQHVELTTVSLEVAIESAVTSLQEVIAETGAGVDCAGPWPCVLAHERTLTQVIFNLVSNALKFVRPGIAPQLRLRPQVLGHLVQVWVEDNGIGIEPAYQAQIFGLFTRLDGDKHPGTGIGLAIVQRGVERMGGRVGVESAPGAGSRFWVELHKA